MLKQAEADDAEFMQDMDNKIFTVFVPSDEAFKLVDQAKLLGLTDKEEDRIALFHFYENMDLTYDELACGETLQAVSGDDSRTICSYVGEGSKKTVAVKYQNGNGNVSKKVDLLVLVFIQFLFRAFLFFFVSHSFVQCIFFPLLSILFVLLLRLPYQNIIPTCITYAYILYISSTR